MKLIVYALQDQRRRLHSLGSQTFVVLAVVVVAVAVLPRSLVIFVHSTAPSLVDELKREVRSATLLGLGLHGLELLLSDQIQLGLHG